MPLRFVLDEHFRGSLWDIIQRHNLFEAALPQLLDFLVLAAHATDPEEWENQIVYVP